MQKQRGRASDEKDGGDRCYSPSTFPPQITHSTHVFLFLLLVSLSLFSSSSFLFLFSLPPPLFSFSISTSPPFPSPPPQSTPDRDSLKLSQEEYDRPPLAAVLQVAVACVLCAWASVRAAGPLRKLAPAANQAPLAGAPFRGTAWMTLGHRGMAMPLRVGVVKPEGGRSF